MKFVKKTDGFTLVELIVVIAILAILAAIAVPAYSGYIQKANEAGDQQLLAALNTAYAAACLENNTDMLDLDGASVTMEGGKVTKIEPYAASFNTYWAANKDTAFKVITGIGFDKAAGVFKSLKDFSGPVSLYYKGAVVEVSAADINTLASSNLGNMGAGTLMGEMQSATTSAGDVLGDLAGTPFNNALVSYLGLNAATATENDIRNAMVALADKYDLDDPSQIRTNAIALYAAQNSSGISQEKIASWLTEDGVDKMMASPSATTLAEGAAIYGLYMSYKGEDFEGVSDTKTAINVLQDATAGDDAEEFAKWVSSPEGKSELDAYLAAMNAISSTTGNSEAAGSVLANGFNDEELVDIMESLMGK